MGPNRAESRFISRFPRLSRLHHLALELLNMCRRVAWKEVYCIPALELVACFP